MKQFLITLSLLYMYMCAPAFAQQYVQKQETQITNILTNPGFESGKTGWSFSNPATVSTVSGTQALFGAMSLKFTPVASVATTISSGLITVPEGLKGEGCQAVFHYRTNEPTNFFVGRVLDASGTVLASVDLEPKTIMGIPTEGSTSQSVDFDCPSDKKIEQQIWQDNVGGYITADGMHLGSKTGGLGNAQDIADALGYTPADQVDLAAVSATVSTNTANIAAISSTALRKDNNLSDVTSATVARSNLGLGSVATESVVPVTKGGTGLTSVGASGTVLSSNESGVAEWLAPESSSIVNFATNPSIEQSTTGWVASGTVNLTRFDRLANGVPYLKGDRYYLSIDSASAGEGTCSTHIIPQNLRGSSIEVSAKYRNGFSVSGTWLMTVTAGTMSTSQTLVMNAAVGLSDQFLDTPKVFMGTTSSTATVQTCMLNLSGSAILHVDNVWVGAARSLKTGAIKTPLQSYTPTIVGFGTPTSVNFQFTQIGDEVKVIGSFISGTSTAVPATISLPNGWLITSKYGAARRILGRGVREINTATTNKNYSVHSVSRTNVVNIGVLEYTPGSNPSSISNGNDIASSGQVMSFEFTVGIEGLSGTGTSFDTVCPNDTSCTNDFVAFVGANGSVSGENLDWISGNCTNANASACTFNPAVFTVAPVCTAAIDNSSGEATTTSYGGTSVAITRYNSGGSLNAAAFILKCSKQGADFVAKRTIEGFLNKTVTTSGQTLDRMVRATVAGATVSTSCTSNPCTVYDSNGGLSTVTWVSTGVFTLNFAASTFSSRPQCFPVSLGSTTSDAVCKVSGEGTANSIAVICKSTSGNALINESFNIHCVGPR